MSPYKLDCKYHEVTDCGWSRWMRARLGRPEFLVWRNRESGIWSAGLWLSRTGNVVSELLILGGDPNLFGRGHAEEIEFELSYRKRDWLKDLKHRVHSRYRGKMRQFDEEVAVQLELREWFRKRSGHLSDCPDWALL